MQFTITTPIDAPADVVWELLGRRFVDISEWSDVVRSSRAIGLDEVPPGVAVAPEAPVPGRSTTTRVTLTEVLTDYDEAGRSLTFVAANLPPVIRNVSDRQSVRAVTAASSEVDFEVRVDLAGPVALFAPLLRRRMQHTFGRVQRELKRAAEAAATAG